MEKYEVINSLGRGEDTDENVWQLLSMLINALAQNGDLKSRPVATDAGDIFIHMPCSVSDRLAQVATAASLYYAGSLFRELEQIPAGIVCIPAKNSIEKKGGMHISLLEESLKDHEGEMSIICILMFREQDYAYFIRGAAVAMEQAELQPGICPLGMIELQGPYFGVRMAELVRGFTLLSERLASSLKQELDDSDERHDPNKPCMN